MIGQSLAHYEITALLGKGGMGEVYRARDTKLGREVAIKVLPSELSGDPERAARFDREARTLASLQHPNIASIYGFEEIDRVRFLVMELVEGEDLATRIEHGRIPLDECLTIARQIATGLEAAHERGIVHRDLKPANIMLNESGDAKILDFGLARAWFGDANNDGTMGHSPTITAAMTQAGTILGTAAYMSPEQARGRNVDRRADIWAFGAILWEMVTGERLFTGETVSDTLAAVLRAEPHWERLPVDEAPQLCRLIERCLVRDPHQRLRDIGEARILLQDGASASSLLSMPTGAALPEHTPRASRAGWFAFGTMTLVAAVLAILLLTRGSDRTLSQTTLGLSANDALEVTRGQFWSVVQISPDGQTVVYSGGSSAELFVRPIDSFESTPLPDTQGASLPVFSPDGRWVAYFAGPKLWKIALSGGAPVEICDTSSGPGLAWGNGELYFARANGGGLWAVSENGGQPRPISTLDDARDEASHRWPRLLPDGRHLLMTVKTARIESFDDASIALLSLETGEARTILQGGTDARFVSSGHLVYARGSNLLAIGFDSESLSTYGTPVPVLDDVHVSEFTGSAYVALNFQGDLAYLPTLRGFWYFQLAWLDRSGQVRDLELDHLRALQPAFAPDGTRFAAAYVAANDKIWVYDLQRKLASRLTNTPGNDRFPVWSADGTRVAFMNDHRGIPDLYVVAADGSAPAELLLQSEFMDWPTSWSPDGTRLLFTRRNSDGDRDLWTLDMTGSGEATPYLATANSELGGRFSPDGKWVLYESDPSGPFDVYVRPYPGPGNARRVSRSGGTRAEWSWDGGTIFYRSGDRQMAVTVDGSAGFRVGEPEELFTMDASLLAPSAFALPTPDGQRFLTTRYNVEATQTQIRVILGWGAGLGGGASTSN